jgi:transcriptional regulator with XRE-family HTH domain
MLEARQDKLDLSAALRALRKAAGLSGQRLADKAHISQSKISRIETGAIIPTVSDVEHILRALEVAPEQASPLLRLARAANVDFMSRRTINKIGVEHRQREIASLIEKSNSVKHALPAMLPGILQTLDYASSNVNNPLSKVSQAERPRLVAAKVSRARLLYEGSRTLAYLLTESAVRTRVGASSVMADQVDHLVAVSSLPGVGIALLNFDIILSTPLISTFAIYDQRLVIIETTAGPVSLRDPADVHEHIDLFDHVHRQALKGDDCRDFLRTVADEFRESGGS